MSRRRGDRIRRRMPRAQGNPNRLSTEAADAARAALELDADSWEPAREREVAVVKALGSRPGPRPAQSRARAVARTHQACGRPGDALAVLRRKDARVWRRRRAVGRRRTSDVGDAHLVGRTSRHSARRRCGVERRVTRGIERPALRTAIGSARDAIRRVRTGVPAASRSSVRTRIVIGRRGRGASPGAARGAREGEDGDGRPRGTLAHGSSRRAQTVPGRRRGEPRRSSVFPLP
jgi:hypothetical protein